MEDPLGVLSGLFDSDSDNNVENNPPLKETINSAKKDDKNTAKDKKKLKEKMRLLQAQMKLLEAEMSQSSDDDDENIKKSSTIQKQNIIKTSSQASTNTNKSQGTQKPCTKSLPSNGNKKILSTECREERQSSLEPLTKRPRVSLVTSPEITKDKKQSPIVSKQQQIKKPSQQNKKQTQSKSSVSSTSSTRDNPCAPGYKDAYSGLNLISPKISSQLLEKRMEGRKFIKLHCISRRMAGYELDGDWVTIAVVVKKFEARKSSNGKTYNIWRLSSMACGHENNTISFFLFGDVYKEHWKLSEGTAIALLNASIMPAKDSDSKDDIAVTVDNPQKLMDLGSCKDFGYCKGTRNSDGKKCSNFVNLHYGDFCEFHVQRAYKKASSKRMELQTGYGAPSHNMNNIKKEITNGGYFYQGKTVTTEIPYDQRKAKPKKSNGKIKEESTEVWNEFMASQSSGSRNFARYLEKSDLKSQDQQKKIDSKQNYTSQKNKQKEIPKIQSFDLKSLLEKKPKLSTTGGSFIEFVDEEDDSIMSNALNNKSSNNNYAARGGSNKSPPISTASDEAKLRAVAYIKKHGPNKQENREEKIRKALSEGNESKNEEKTATSKEKKSKSVLADIFGPLDIESDKGKKLLAAESSHAGSVQEARAEKLEEYFNVKEKKERYEEKMSSIMELKVTLVCCKICKYKAEGASKLCKDQNHKVMKIEGKKRFFECKNCKQRTTAYSQIPSRPCRSCNELNYRRVAMFKESKGPKMDCEKLLLRGEEKKFINS